MKSIVLVQLSIVLTILFAIPLWTQSNLNFYSIYFGFERTFGYWESFLVNILFSLLGGASLWANAVASIVKAVWL